MDHHAVGAVSVVLKGWQSGLPCTWRFSANESSPSFSAYFIAVKLLVLEMLALVVPFSPSPQKTMPPETLLLATTALAPAFNSIQGMASEAEKLTVEIFKFASFIASKMQ